MRKKVYIAAGATSLFYGPGRKEFNPHKEMPSFESYLQETSQESLMQVSEPLFDEGIIGSFMSPRFLHQANIAGFLPMMVPQLLGKGCTGVEGACGTGGRCLAVAIRSILSDLSDAVFVSAFEVQNCVKSVYGADILAGAAYYRGMRKEGHAFFFPGIFSDRAGAYYKKYDEDLAWKAMAKWYEKAILNARKNPKAQEYHNTNPDPYKTGLTPCDAKGFLPCLNLYHCSKVTDGAASLGVFSEEGLKKCGIDKKNAVEVVAIGEAEGNISLPPPDPTSFAITKIAAQNALQNGKLTVNDLGLLEVHDCFGISALLSLEAIGIAPPGKAPEYLLNGSDNLVINASGGLTGFGHPTGASGVRMMVDLQKQLTGTASNQASPRSPYGMMVSMGGNDITVTAIIVKKIYTESG
jgi:acetyl-CoA C-acetyltransferase